MIPIAGLVNHVVPGTEKCREMPFFETHAQEHGMYIPDG